MHEQFRQLDREIEGDVKTDTLTRLLYSVDASIFQIAPTAVIWPKSAADVTAAVAFAAGHGLTVTARGAATGLTGACLSDGLIIDTGRYMNRILQLDPTARLAVCQPGVIQDQLNRAAGEHGLRLGPDTSTGNRATLGGMLGNNSSGAHSLRFGQMVDHVREVALVTAAAALARFAATPVGTLPSLGTGDSDTARIWRGVARLRETRRQAIRTEFPAIHRRVGGYNLNRLIDPDTINLAEVICGSEGTFGVATELTVRLSPQPPFTGVCVLQLDDLFAGLRHIEWLLTHQPYALELIDDRIIEAGRRSPAMQSRLGWLDGAPDGLLVVEFEGNSEREVADKLATFAKRAAARGIGYNRQQLLDPAAVADVWALRKAGLGMLMGSRTSQRAIAFMEDTAVPIAHLPEFMEHFRERLASTGRQAGFYGHAGGGCIHVRPMLDLRRRADLGEMLAIMAEMAEQLKHFGGALSSEHGDGLVRSWLNEKMFGPTIYQSFRELKAAFDPENRMNPGKIVDAPPPTERLRIGPGTPEGEIATVFDFTAEGGFCFATEMCNGNGECRKPDTGVMCPSFQATGDEKDSTRGRATCLQAIVHGDLPMTEFTGAAMREVMDLCLQCKGCRKECPSEVDMAKFKAEFLHHYHTAHGYPLRARIFGAMDRLGVLGSLTAPLTNRLQRTGPIRALLDRLGIDRRRQLPEYAARRFTTWCRRRAVKTPPTGERVVLFADTWTEFNVPPVGQAAMRVLEALDCAVVVPPHTCCGRPQISKGMLRRAQRKARKLVDTLLPYVRQGYHVIGLEPSCILTVRDEYRCLIPGADTAAVADACLTMDEYLHGRLTRATLNLRFASRTPPPIFVHGHCHQKALSGVGMTTEVLRAIPHADVREIDSGCCGMAGAFGYEKEHYDVSMRVGETRLFPAIRALPEPAIIVADGVSCRAQIEHGTGRTPQHMVEVLADCLHP